MRNYEFKVNFERVLNGTVDVDAETLEEATEKALSYIGKQLSDALPELDIEYRVEETKNYNEEELENYIKENYKGD